MFTFGGAIALLFALTLVACGGGGGGSTTDTSSSGGTTTSTGSTCAGTCVEVDGVAYTCGDETKMATYCVAFRTDNGTLYKSDPSIAVTATWTDWGNGVITNRLHGLPNGDEVVYNIISNPPVGLQYGDGRGTSGITFSGVGDGNWITFANGYDYWVKKNAENIFTIGW